MPLIEQVAVLGAGGTMGFPMARNMARAGLGVRAWNRSAEKAEPLKEAGVAVASTPAEAADRAQAIVTMLADAEAVLESMDGDEGALAGVSEGATWIQMSTLGIEGTERCAELADERGIAFVDAPVLGTKQPAEKGELVVLASGPEDSRERVAPIFDAVGKQTIWAGEAGAGSRLKLVT